MNDMQYLIFEVLGEKYALVLEHVAEIMDPPDIYPVPKAPYYYRGMMNCHGRPMPVLDLALLFKKVSCGKTGKMLVLVGKTVNLALLVNRVIDIVSGRFPLKPASGSDGGVEKSLVVAEDAIKMIEPERLLEILEEEMNG